MLHEQSMNRAMVENLAERVDMCPLNQGRYMLFMYNWERETCPSYGVVGYPLFTANVKEKVSGYSGLSIISWMSAVEGYLLSKVPL